VPDEVTAGLDTVGLRVPSHPVALALLREARLPIAAPSANRSTELSPTTAQHVAKGLGDRVEMILDAGPTMVGIESTVVDISGTDTVILRPGVIGPEDLEPIVGRVRFVDTSAPGAASTEALRGSSDRGTTADETPRPSPGMMDRHYAPRARVLLFRQGERPQAAAEARALLRRAAQSGSGPRRLAAHPGVIAVLERNPAWLEALARQVGGAIGLRADPSIAITGGHAEPA
jgi:L-threonylcarbamoyladenylate synthase